MYRALQFYMIRYHTNRSYDYSSSSYITSDIISTLFILQNEGHHALTVQIHWLLHHTLHSDGHTDPVAFAVGEPSMCSLQCHTLQCFCAWFHLHHIHQTE